MICACCTRAAEHVDRDRDGRTYLCCGVDGCWCLGKSPFGKTKPLETATARTLGMPGTMVRSLKEHR